MAETSRDILCHRAPTFWCSPGGVFDRSGASRCSSRSLIEPRNPQRGNRKSILLIRFSQSEGGLKWHSRRWFSRTECNVAIFSKEITRGDRTFQIRFVSEALHGQKRGVADLVFSRRERPPQGHTGYQQGLRLSDFQRPSGSRRRRGLIVYDGNKKGVSCFGHALFVSVPKITLIRSAQLVAEAMVGFEGEFPQAVPIGVCEAPL